MALHHLISGSCRDYIPELPSIQLRRPNFEAVHLRISHKAGIEQELLAFIRQLYAILSAAKIAVGSEKDLQGCQTLLTINHLAHDDVACGSLFLVKHHCAKEMDRRIRASFKRFKEFA